MNYQLYHGDCLDIMPQLIAQGVKVDAIITGDRDSRSILEACGTYDKGRQG